MDDARVRRHDFEILERLLAPAQEGVALAVALELEVGVGLEGAGSAEFIHLHGMVDHQLGGLQRIDLLRIAAQLLHGVAHRCQIHHRGHAGEVLQQDARGHERDLLVRRRFGVPLGERADIFGLHRFAIFEAQQILQQDAQGVRQARGRETLLVERVEAPDLVFTFSHTKLRAALETVLHDFCPSRMAIPKPPTLTQNTLDLSS